jgi:hypothetical protein
MGGVTHHNEMLRRRDGKVLCLYARHPRTGYIDFERRLDQFHCREIIFAVYRFHRFCDDGDYRCDDPTSYRDKVGASLDTMDECLLKYDWTAIRSIGWNFLRSALGPVKTITKQSEHKVYCTESCEIATRLGGIKAFDGIPEQPCYAPIHFERVIRCDRWRLVRDYGGMHEMIVRRSI